MRIEILGPGCVKCRATERNVHIALEQLHVAAEVDHIYDPKEFSKRGVMFTPAVIIDGVMKVSGKIPSVDQVKSWLTPNA